jgi:dethiobiotin synthetase
MNTHFIIGTDTGIGKTHVTCQLAKKWIKQGKVVKILKPIATGCTYINDRLVSEDTLRYEKTLTSPSSTSEGWAFEPPVSPHLAAELSGTPVFAQDIANWCNAQWQLQDEIRFIEGAGGLMVPLNDHETWLDVIRLLNIPVILVVGIRLGCLNHAILTSEVLQARDIQIAGWVANHMDISCLYPERLIQTLKAKFYFPCLMELPFEPHRGPG